MKVLITLKYLINFIFYAYMPLAIGLVVYPFLNRSHYIQSWQETWLGMVVFPSIHLIVIFFILFFIRKFVINSFAGKHFQDSSRKYLKVSGFLCLAYAFIKMPELAGWVTLYKVSGSFDSYYILTGFLNLGGVCLIILIGLFLIYLSKLLELSYLLKQENQLTI